MCGIYGQYRPGGADPALIERMAQRLAHRGPDGYGTYHRGDLAFGSGRLAIIDLSAGFQPIFSEDRRVAVVFNGEIYNYRALRADLEKLGHQFATQTDTEVIVHGYESWGEAVLERLRGMFALCVWDEPNERLLLARDRLGEKPLYYAPLPDGEFIFASEAKALFEHPGLRRAVNHEVLMHLLVLGYVPPPATVFAGVEKLAPGERLIVERARWRRDYYWQPQLDSARAERVSYREAVGRTRRMVQEAIEMQMMSDVPIGAFLSGGVDSTIVVAVMRAASAQPVNTFTVGFDMPAGSKEDHKFNVDARYAALVAAQFGTTHHVITLRQDERLAALLPHLVHAMDEPIATATMVQTAYVAALARIKGVPVMLTGEAGDEMFLGYDHYRADQMIDRYRKIPALLRNGLLNPLLERLPGARLEGMLKLAQKSRLEDPVDRYLTWLRLVSFEHAGGLLAQAGAAQAGIQAIRSALEPFLAAPRTPHFADRVAYTGLRLPMAEHYGNMRVDKMSMLMSIEARSPLQDYRLVEFALQLPLAYKLRGGGFKTVLKDAFADSIPEAVLKRPKWGFNPPASEWLRTALRPLVETYLAPERVAAAGCFDPKAVSQVVRAHIVERKYALWPLWSLLVFHVWHALYIEQTLTLAQKLHPADLYGRAADMALAH